LVIWAAEQQKCHDVFVRTIDQAKRRPLLFLAPQSTKGQGIQSSLADYTLLSEAASTIWVAFRHNGIGADDSRFKSSVGNTIKLP